MPFSTLSSDGISITCFLVEHDWETRFSIAHYFPTDITVGLSERESRRTEAEAWLLSVSVQIFAEETEAQDLRQTFATLNKSWVGIPLLCDQFDGADYAILGQRIYAAQRYIDLTVPAILAAGDPMTAGHTYAPLLVGHITRLPAISPLSEGLALCAAVVTEDSPWTFRIGSAVTPSAGTWPIALEPDWSTPPIETPVKDLTFERISLQREQSIGQEERAFKWTNEAGFYLVDKTEIATLLGFFLVSSGTWQPFDAPMWWTPGTPTAEAPHTSTMRFAEPTLRIEFDSSSLAEARIKFAQVPWEIEGTEGEEPLQAPRVFFYKFRYDLPTPIYFRFTNWARSLAISGDGTYQPGPFMHDEIRETADLSGDTVTLNSFLFTGNPLAMFNPRTLEGRLWLEIWETESNPVDPDAATLRWSGSVRRAPQKGRKFTAECVWMGGILDREIPAVRIGPSCNTRIYAPPCTLLKASFEKTGTLDSSSDHTVVVTTADAAVAGAYALGWIEVNTGVDFEMRAIVGSEPVTGGQQLILDEPLRQSATSQAVKYYPGCDGSAARCTALGNFENFRGQPNLPRVNLSIPSYNQPATGKK